LLPQICDRVVLSATLFLIIFAPLAYGAVDPWAQLLIRIVVLVMLGSWALKTAYLRELVTEPSSPALRRFPFCLSSAGCGYLFLQWTRLLLATYGGASRLSVGAVRGCRLRDIGRVQDELFHLSPNIRVVLHFVVSDPEDLFVPADL
jgi:hypothetical protein